MRVGPGRALRAPAQESSFTPPVVSRFCTAESVDSGTRQHGADCRISSACSGSHTVAPSVRPTERRLSPPARGCPRRAQLLELQGPDPSFGLPHLHPRVQLRSAAADRIHHAAALHGVLLEERVHGEAGAAARSASIRRMKRKTVRQAIRPSKRVEIGPIRSRARNTRLVARVRRRGRSRTAGSARTRSGRSHARNRWRAR